MAVWLALQSGGGDALRQSRSEVVAVQQRCTELEAALATEKTWREEREQFQPDGESHGSARQLAAAKLVRLRGKSFNRQQAASLR